MNTPTFNEMMTTYAEDAVDFARNNFGISLDYTSESIEQVELVADRLFQSRPKGFLGRLFRKGLSDEDVQIICKMLGGYLGEVYRRARGGEWAMNQELQVIGLLTGDTWIFPPAKVHKRLTNGAEDNLWSYFRVMLDKPFKSKNS